MATPVITIGTTIVGSVFTVVNNEGGSLTDVSQLNNLNTDAQVAGGSVATRAYAEEMPCELCWFTLTKQDNEAIAPGR